MRALLCLHRTVHHPKPPSPCPGALQCGERGLWLNTLNQRAIPPVRPTTWKSIACRPAHPHAMPPAAAYLHALVSVTCTWPSPRLPHGSGCATWPH